MKMRVAIKEVISRKADLYLFINEKLNKMNTTITLILTCLILIPFGGVSQTVFPKNQDNPKWEYVKWRFWGGQCEARKILTGDEVVKCNQKYIEIIDCNEDETQCELIGYYRLQGDSVVVRTNYPYFDGKRDTVICSEGEGLMYDFGTSNQDSLQCQLNSTFPASQIDFVQLDQREIDYEGTMRTTRLMKYSPYVNAPGNTSLMNWIEGVGSDVHPFYSLSCIGDHCEQELQLIRVWNQKELIYSDTALRFTFPCNGWITSTSNDPISEINIYPNPTKNTLHFTQANEINEEVDVSIFNTSGLRVKMVNNHLISRSMDVRFLKPGSYVIRVENDHGIQQFRMIKL